MNSSNNDLKEILGDVDLVQLRADLTTFYQTQETSEFLQSVINRIKETYPDFIARQITGIIQGYTDSELAQMNSNPPTSEE